MASEQRIYKVTNGANTTLVQAASQAQALRHVAGKMFTAEIAKTIEVARLMGQGAGLEVASVIPEQMQLEV